MAIAQEGNLSEKDMIALYRYLLLSRRFDERINELYATTQKINELPHSHIGQEAIGVGSCYGLRRDDYILPSLRTRPAVLTRGVPVKLLIAGIFGKRTGPAGGRVTTHHLGAPEFGIVGTTGIVGGHIAVASGAALACKMKKKDSVVLCFFGDGATSQGDFHEAANFAGLYNLPLLLIVENNQFAAMTTVSRSVSGGDIAGRAKGYGFPGIKVDGNDVLEVHRRAQEAVERARQGLGPTLLECVTYRIRSHAEQVPEKRSAEEIDEWKRADPVARMKERLLVSGVLSESAEAQLDKEVRAEIEEGVRFADESPFPDASEMSNGVYGPRPGREERIPENGSKMSVGRALNQALREEMSRDETVFVIGEDLGADAIGPPGGLWPPTKNLCNEFPDRVVGTPLCESEIVGAAAGAAIAGLRPVVEIMFSDFVTLAMDNIVNYSAKMRYNYSGQLGVPMVIRAPFGIGGSMGLHHSQSPEAWFMNIPGLKIVMPSTPRDAKGLLKASIRDGDPVIFLEHKMLYGVEGDVPEGEYVVPLGRADVKRQGEDVTIVASGLMVSHSLSAAEKLQREGISAEVVDPRTLLPLDKDTIIASVRKTSRLVIVHEAPKFGGPGGEIAATVAEEALEYLDAPIQRVGAPFTPVPFSRPLEKAYVPSVEQIVASVKKTLSAD
jgi:pyruvate/2-oxoglutarate/acetoin dehydrogenase E1 component/TPP-dependent pyruvate/acetoin dehydrogenase alpha subunit